MLRTLTSTLVVIAATVQAQPPASPQPIPAALYESLRDVINTGADLFNLQADYSGCFRVFQGSLLSIKPLLSPDMQREVDQAFARAEKKTTFADRSYELRAVLDRIRDKVKPAGVVTENRPLNALPEMEKRETIRVAPKKADS